jgi:hypothetical protein
MMESKEEEKLQLINGLIPGLVAYWLLFCTARYIIIIPGDICGKI